MKKNILILICLLILLAPCRFGQALSFADDTYPKIVNLYWKTPITREEAKELAKWDMLALSMAAQSDSADNIRYIRKLNPDIIILAYTSATELPVNRLNTLEPAGVGLWHNLTAAASPEWYLKTCTGKNISWWPGNTSMNLYAKNANGVSYADYLADFYQREILSSGLWDGLLFDTVWNNISWLDENIDIDADGKKDSETEINESWQIGHRRLFENLRAKIGRDKLIIINGDGNYQNIVNGRVFESFPEYWDGDWTGSVASYRNNDQNGYSPRINIINSDTDNTGNSADYQKMRYGLASALLFGGYFSFDYGTELREQLWWYDEYDAYLGKAKTAAVNLLSSNSEMVAGIWKRDFENGIIIVNSTNKEQEIEFDSEYEKIHGSQDKTVNNGAIINSLNIDSGDGIILLRPIEEVKDSVYGNGSFARVFNESGKNIRTGFFAYDSKFKGGTEIIKTDINNDNAAETVVAEDNHILFYNSAGIRKQIIFPYGQKYSAGLSIAAADTDGDGKKEIIVGPKTGQANLIKIYDCYGRETGKSWNAFNSRWASLGANVAAGDINGDGKAEIVVGAGYGGGPQVRIFDGSGKLISGGFFAYDQAFRGGVNVAVGDVNDDKISEIITGPGYGGGPHVAIFSARGEKLGEWIAYDSKLKEGIRVIASDLDGDNKDEIVTLTTSVFTLSFSKDIK